MTVLETESSLAGSGATALLALAVAGESLVLVSGAGEVGTFRLNRAQAVVRNRVFLVCHARLIRDRLQVEALDALDLLELFAFVHPGQFVVPTPRGLAQALDLPEPTDAATDALTLWLARDALLGALGDLTGIAVDRAALVAQAMARGGWRWAGDVLTALGRENEMREDPVHGLAVWHRLPEWEDGIPPPEKQAETEADAVRARLAQLVEQVLKAEPRPEQSDYASALTSAFGPSSADTSTALVLAEAGTGVGKTLGYLAPASLWAEASGRAVWISTYTRNLQRQIEAEARRLPGLRTVVRKGRENYLCLLNFEEAVRAAFGQPQTLVALGLIARWLDVTRDGDLRGGDLPGWLADLVGRGRVFGLADRRGECIHSACPHYRRCFIESSVRAARRADLVIANHALLLSAAASGGVDEQYPPSRFVFDEGHHLFQAADSAFGCDLSGQATHDLRRWLVGGEGGRKNRVRGLSKRAEPLLPDTAEGLALLDSIRQHAALLPAEGWLGRLENGEPRGAVERFLVLVRQQVLARDPDVATPYSLECPPCDPDPELLIAARRLRQDLGGLAQAVQDLRASLLARQKAEAVDDEEQRRIDSLNRTLDSYVLEQLRGWIALLDSLATGPDAAFSDWFGIDRVEGRSADIGFFRRYLDPMQPMAEALQRQAHGVVITSATLTDSAPHEPDIWRAAEAESGARHFARPAWRVRVPSPFDYAKQTRVLVVPTVDGRDIHALTAAYRDLFLASGGGALGLFTAIERLKRVQAGLRAPLAAEGLPLYAQHLDGLDPHTLIDIFRAEGNACLLGTDAVRDGVDVPGRALRLIVFDRIPWPRTNLLLKARKDVFGGAAYVEHLARQCLRQAFGRLVRRADDRGVFVLLAPLPSRLASAFPDVVPERVSLQEAVGITHDFLSVGPSPHTAQGPGSLTPKSPQQKVSGCAGD